MKFSRLDDTQYPNIGNVDVYAFRNTFDYTRWVAGTELHMVNVLWDSSYSNVVSFDSDKKRDEWFDSIDNKANVTLMSNVRAIPDAQVKIPLPYDVASKYNYLYIDLPIATSNGAMIDNETDDGNRRWYFFVDGISYLSPNSTAVSVTIDVWTCFANSVDIEYLMLERGHAPVTMVTPEQYLSAPAENCKYLLAPDVNLDTTYRNAKSRFMPVMNGEKFVCIASTIPPSSISSCGTVSNTKDATFSNPTYSDSGARYGYQLVVNGFGFGDGRDMSGVACSSGNASDRSGLVCNNVTMYAFRTSDSGFLDDCISTVPGFIQGIVGCFVITGELITLGTAHGVAGHTIWEVRAAQPYMQDVSLSKSDFGFPREYSEYAKLYTYPYSYLQVTDNSGETYDIRIEETDGLTLRTAASLAFPYVNVRSFLDGVRGSGHSSYTVHRLDGSAVTKDMPNADWFEYCFDMGIPTYAIYMDARTEYLLGSYNRAMSNARRSALVGYHNSVRSANTAMQNAIDSSNTGNANAKSSNSTQEGNVNASMSTMVSNMENTNATTRANADLAIACATANTARGVTAAINNNTTTINQSYTATLNANNVTAQSTSTENQATSSAAFNSGISGIIGSAGSGAVTGAMVAGGPGALAGLGAGIATGVANWIGANMNAQTTVNANEQIAAITESSNTAIFNNNANASQITTVESGNCSKDQTTNTNNCTSSQTNNSIATYKRNTENNAATGNANAARTRSTGDANADRTTATSNANSGYTREVSVLNSKETLENAQNGSKAALMDAAMGRPTRLTDYSGDMAPDAYGTRGMQIKVKTQGAASIAMAGDAFARYGYTLNQVWNVRDTGFKLMKHFTYWKASDVWVRDTGNTGNYVNRQISDILTSGVTVWGNPDEIGRVSIYDNQ